MRIRDITTLPRRVQPVRHIISRKRRHREMQERAEQFWGMLENEIKHARQEITNVGARCMEGLDANK